MTSVREEAISSELGVDEPLLWSGRPRTGLRLLSGDARYLPSSMVENARSVWALIPRPGE